MAIRLFFLSLSVRRLLYDAFASNPSRDVPESLTYPKYILAIKNSDVTIYIKYFYYNTKKSLYL